MTIPASPPPEPPVLLRVERIESGAVAPDASQFNQLEVSQLEAEPGEYGADLLLDGVEPAGLDEKPAAIAELSIETPLLEIETERSEPGPARSMEVASPIAQSVSEEVDDLVSPANDLDPILLDNAAPVPETLDPLPLDDDPNDSSEPVSSEPIAGEIPLAPLAPPDLDDGDIPIRDALDDDRDTLIIDGDFFEIEEAEIEEPEDAEEIEVEPIDLQNSLRLSSPLEVTADRQTFDRNRQIFTAIGNATMRYAGGLLEADRIQVNLLTRMARGVGNVALTRTDGTVLRGEKVRYNFAQEMGTIERATGEISTAPTVPAEEIPQTVAVPSTTLLPVPIGSRVLADEPQSDRFLEEGPTGVFTTGGFNFSLGTSREFRANQQIGALGTLSRFRFDAATLDFYPDGWAGNDVRITTDPFSPPESELRADRMVVTPLDPLRDELLMTRPRLVFDDGFSLPVLKRRYILDRSDPEPPLLEFGFDQRDRDGFYLQRTFQIINTPNVTFEVAPQFYVQRALTGEGDTETAPSITEDSESFLDNFGFTTELLARINDRTSLAAETSLVNLNIDDLDIDKNLRASARLTHRFLGNHRLTGEYTFRNRLFNGSLGFRTVHSSLGVILNSPPIFLGDTGIVMNYQLGANRINADTDEAELLKPVRDNNRVTLLRYQGSVSLDRGWNLWVGETLPATREAGLRYTPAPVLPYLRFFAGVRGITGFYSNGASEHSLRGTVGIQGQFGHFSKPAFDYTSVFARYSESLITGESPFQFDRVADRRTVSLGVMQQVVGPLRLGFQTVINLDRSEAISTDYILEYSRRTFGVTLAFNPQREAGSLQLRISDFDWNGNAGAFSNRETCQGVRDLFCDANY